MNYYLLLITLFGIGNPFTKKDLKKKKHPLVPLPDNEIPDEGDFRAGHIRSNTVRMNRRTEDSGEEEEKPQKKYNNPNEMHDYYAASFGLPPSNIT